MEQVGLSAKLRFDAGNAIAGMNKTNTAFGRMAKNAKRVKAGMNNLRTGFRGAGIVAAAMGAGVVKTVKDFASFDFQVTKAISLTKDGAANMDRLRKFAKKMGAETFFTSKQAAEGMEALARAGLRSSEVMAALPKVLQLAAAEGLDLKRATEIVVKASGQFGIKMKNAATITDTLAFVSKNTATDVNQLAEGMKYVGTKAGRGLNITMQQTVGVLGLLANVASDASVGGTVLNNALIKIGKNAKNGEVRVGKFRARIEQTFDEKTGKRGVNLIETMKNVAKAASKIADPVKRSAAITKLLGIRGEKASLAFTAAFGKDKIAETTEFLTKLQTNTKGAAKSLADAQIHTHAGQFKIFQSAASGVSIAIGKMLLTGTPLVPFMKRVTTVLSAAAGAMSLLAGDPKTKAGLEQRRVGLAKLDKTGVSLARGLRQGFAAVKEVLSTVKGVITSIGSAFGINFGKTQLSDVIRIGAKTLSWVVVLKTATNLLGRMGAIAKGSFQIIRGGLGMAVTAGGGILKTLGAKAPLLARIGSKMPGIAGRLAGAISSVEKITAQPVRIVNFDEAGMGGAVGGAAGGAGALSGLGTGIKNLATAASGIQSLAGKLAAKGGLIAAAGGAGYAIGTLADRMFGISDKISDAVVKPAREAGNLRAKIHGLAIEFSAQRDTLEHFARLRKTTKTVRSGKSHVGITRELVESRLRAQMSKQGRSKQQQDKIVSGFKDLLSKFPTKEQFMARNKDLKIVNEVKLDGKVIARSVAVRQEEQDQRLGKKSKVGTKRKARTK